MNTLAAEMQTYFSVFARSQRDLSEHTICACRDTWRMLIMFLAVRTEHIDFNHIDAGNVIASFLTYFEHERGNDD